MTHEKYLNCPNDHSWEYRSSYSLTYIINLTPTSYSTRVIASPFNPLFSRWALESTFNTIRACTILLPFCFSDATLILGRQQHWECLDWIIKFGYRSSLKFAGVIFSARHAEQCYLKQNQTIYRIYF